jgi:hypothetical protein
MKQVRKSSDGKYHVHGKVYDELVGSRRQVFNGSAYKTAGGLKKDNLVQNKKTRAIVSKKKHLSAKRDNRLVKAGYGTKKGHFGWVRVGKAATKSAKKTRKNKSRRARK